MRCPWRKEKEKTGIEYRDRGKVSKARAPRPGALTKRRKTTGFESGRDSGTTDHPSPCSSARLVLVDSRQSVAISRVGPGRLLGGHRGHHPAPSLPVLHLRRPSIIIRGKGPVRVLKSLFGRIDFNEGRTRGRCFPVLGLPSLPHHHLERSCRCTWTEISTNSVMVPPVPRLACSLGARDVTSAASPPWHKEVTTVSDCPPVDARPRGRWFRLSRYLICQARPRIRSACSRLEIKVALARSGSSEPWNQRLGHRESGDCVRRCSRTLAAHIETPSVEQHWQSIGKSLSLRAQPVMTAHPAWRQVGCKIRLAKAFQGSQGLCPLST
jgi:hypothetical protein